MTTTGGLFRSGHLTEEGIGLYVDGLKLSRTGELPKELLHHVAECGRCRTEIVELYQLLEEVPYVEGSRHPFFDRKPVILQRPSRIPYAIAAILMAAIGITYVMSRVATRDERSLPEQEVGVTTMAQPETVYAAKPDPVKELPVPHHPDESPLAADFAPSPNLEDLVGSDVRSSTVEIVSPLPGDTLSGPIRFSWKAGAGEAVRILILSNMERVVESADVTGSAYVLGATLSPGLYYWKLEGNDELLAVGKFIVQ
jgi:hypothetical protein